MNQIRLRLRAIGIVRYSIPVILLLAAWQFVAMSGWTSAALFPPPTRVVMAGIEMAKSGELLRDIIASFGRLALGLVFGSGVGVFVGLVTGRVSWVRDAIEPLIQLFRPLPPVAIIPLVIVWFGIGEFAKIFSIAFAVFFPVWVNTHAGARQIPQKLLWGASTLTNSRLRTFRRVILPASLPFIVAGLRVGIAIGFVMVFVAELAGASEGIGYLISVSHLAYRIDKMMAGLVVLGASGALADYLFSVSVIRLSPWLKLPLSK